MDEGGFIWVQIDELEWEVNLTHVYMHGSRIDKLRPEFSNHALAVTFD